MTLKLHFHMHVNPFSSSKAHQDGLDLGQNKEMEKRGEENLSTNSTLSFSHAWPWMMKFQTVFGALFYKLQRTEQIYLLTASGIYGRLNLDPIVKVLF